MPEWIIKRTDTFLKHLKKHKNNHELLNELDKKIQRMKEEPHIGGCLSGALQGKRSTRLVAKYRLIFQIDEETLMVELVALDHRGEVYE